jgi:hypothetical protein
MHSFHPRNERTATLLIRGVALGAVLAAIGCASPGPPRAPSLNLPELVRDLTVTRIGNTVELHFTAPSRSTDKLPLRGGKVTGQLCRQLDHQPCLPVPSSKTTVATGGPNGTHNLVTWTDTLPTDLAQGSPRLLTYRVEFFSPAGQSAGASAPAVTAAGSPPPPAGNLHAEGSRLGVVLSWDPSPQPGDILLRREDLAPTPPPQHKPSSTTTKAPPPIVWLGTHPPTDTPAQPNRMLDATALPDTPYRYIAQRRLTIQLGVSSIELRSAPSAPITFTLHETYPPLAPTGLTAVGFFTPTPSTFAIDLVWQPVDNTGLLAGLAGYNIYREPLSPTGEPTAARTRLNTSPVQLPGFHDTTANPTTSYRYSVTAIDAKGNESSAATVLLEPSAAQ